MTFWLLQFEEVSLSLFYVECNVHFMERNIYACIYIYIYLSCSPFVGVDIISCPRTSLNIIFFVFAATSATACNSLLSNNIRFSKSMPLWFQIAIFQKDCKLFESYETDFHLLKWYHSPQFYHCLDYPAPISLLKP